MAWLSGLTGKAENFLNSLDQKAHTALQTEDSDPAQQGDISQLHHTATAFPPPSTTHTPFLSVQSKQQILPAQSVPAKLHDLRTPGEETTSAKGKKKVHTDESLFEFLNTPEPVERRKGAAVSGARHSRQSSSSSVISNKGSKNGDGPGSSSTSGSSLVHVEMPGSDSRGSLADLSPDMDALEDAMHDQSSSNSVHSNQELDSHEDQMTSSSLDLENRLLKNEITSLNQEMSSLVQRAKESETELARLKEKMRDQSRSVSRTDHTVRELQHREQDLLEALGAKDSQLAVLRVRFEEADRELEVKQKALGSLHTDRERILRDHSDSSGIHGQALDSLRNKLTEVEGALQREQDAYKKSQEEAAERRARLQEEQQGFTEALTVAERKLNDEKARVVEVSNQLKVVKNSLVIAKQELAEYKEKATRILQSKERLIASLREGSGASGEAAGVSSLEYDTVKQERDMFKEEIQQSRMTVDNYRLELADLEAQLQQESDTAQDSIRSLDETVAEEKRRREDSEHELLKQKRDVQYAVEELHKQKTSFQSRLNERESDVEKLRNQLQTKSMSSTTEYELESRVRELTESLIHKQTMVEALSTEKNSLGLQLERIQQQYKDVQASAMRTNTAVITVHDDDDVRQRLPLFMREVPTDTGVTRKVKRAVSSIDKFSIRLGVFLRRYPIARVFMIVYMALLHLWVMIVLLTYQQEIHDIGYMMPAPPGGVMPAPPEGAPHDK